MTTPTPETSVLDALRDAINSGDPVRVADCFTDDYRAELPHHPERSFTGNEQVRKNWTMIFAGISDLQATVLRTARSGGEIWSEWQMTGRAADGSPVTLVGPVVLTTRDAKIAWARFYVDRSGTPAD